MMNNQQNNMYAANTNNTSQYYYPPNVQPFLLGVPQTNSILPQPSVQQSYTLNSIDVTQSRFVVNTFQIGGQVQHTPASVHFPQQTDPFLDSISGRSVAQLGQPTPQGQHVAGSELTPSLPNSVFSSVSSLSNYSNRRTPPAYQYASTNSSTAIQNPNCAYNQTVSSQVQVRQQSQLQQSPLQMVPCQVPASQQSHSTQIHQHSQHHLGPSQVHLHQPNQLRIPSPKQDHQPNQLQAVSSQKQKHQPNQLQAIPSQKQQTVQLPGITSQKQTVPLHMQNHQASQLQAVPSQNRQIQAATSQIQLPNQIQAHQQNPQKSSVNNNKNSGSTPTCVASAALNIHQFSLPSGKTANKISHVNNNNKTISNRNTVHNQNALVGNPRAPNPPTTNSQNSPLTNQILNPQSNVHANLSRSRLAINNSGNINQNANHSNKKLQAIRPALPQISSATHTNKQVTVQSSTSKDKDIGTRTKPKKTVKFPVYSEHVLQGTEPIVIEPIEGYEDDDDICPDNATNVATPQNIATNVPNREQPRPTTTKSNQRNTNIVQSGETIQITPQSKLSSPSHVNSSNSNRTNEQEKSPKTNTCERTKSMQEHLVEKLQKTSFKNISTASLDHLMKEYRTDMARSNSEAKSLNESSDEANSSGNSIVDEVMGAIRNLGRKCVAGKTSSDSDKDVSKTNTFLSAISVNNSVNESRSPSSLNTTKVTTSINEDSSTCSMVSKDGTNTFTKSSKFVNILPKPISSSDKDNGAEPILIQHKKHQDTTKESSKSVQDLSKPKDGISFSGKSSDHVTVPSVSDNSQKSLPNAQKHKEKSKPAPCPFMIQPAGVPHRFKVIDGPIDKAQHPPKIDTNKSDSVKVDATKLQSEKIVTSKSQSMSSKSQSVSSESTLMKLRPKFPEAPMENESNQTKLKQTEVDGKKDTEDLLSYRYRDNNQKDKSASEKKHRKFHEESHVNMRNDEGSKSHKELDKSHVNKQNDKSSKSPNELDKVSCLDDQNLPNIPVDTDHNNEHNENVGTSPIDKQLECTSKFSQESYSETTSTLFLTKNKSDKTATTKRDGESYQGKYNHSGLSIQLDPVDYILRGKNYISMRQFESRMLQAIYYPEKRLKDTSKGRHERYLKRTSAQESKRKTRSHKSHRQRSMPLEVPSAQIKLQETLSIMDELRNIVSDSESDNEQIVQGFKNRKRKYISSSDDESDDDYRPKKKNKKHSKKSHKRDNKNTSNACTQDSLSTATVHDNEKGKEKENNSKAHSESIVSNGNNMGMTEAAIRTGDKVKAPEPVLSALTPFRHIKPKVTPDSPHRPAVITSTCSNNQTLLASPPHSQLLGLSTSPLHASSLQPVLQPSNITLLINQPNTGISNTGPQNSLTVEHAQPQLAQVQTSTVQLQAPSIQIQTQPATIQLQQPVLPIQTMQPVQLQPVVTPLQNVLPTSNILNVTSGHNNSFQSP